MISPQSTRRLQKSASLTPISLATVVGLTVGDYLECTPTAGSSFLNSGPELKMIVDITGDVVTVEPPFRVTPASGNAVTFDKASCRFMLDTNDQVGWSASGSIYLSNFRVSCMEAF